MSSDLHKKRLGDYVKIRTGKLDANANDPDGAYPFFTCAENTLRISTYTYDCECILIAGNGDLNVKYYEGKFDAYQRTYIVESLDKSLLNVRYLYHFMSLYVERLRSMSIGGVIKYIKLDYLTEAQIPLPPLDEQKRIAAILDKADALREKRRHASTKLDTLLQSVFLDMFGDPVTNPKEWPIRAMGECADTLTGFAFKSNGYVHAQIGVRLCRGANVLPDQIDWSDSVYWPNDDVDRVQRYALQKEDVVIAMDRPWISTGLKVAMIQEPDLPCFLVQRVTRIRGNEGVPNDYLYCLIKHESFTKHCKPTETTVPHISPIEISSFPIPYPPKERMHAFATIARKINESQKDFLRSEQSHETLFQSLQHRAFNGEL